MAFSKSVRGTGYRFPIFLEGRDQLKPLLSERLTQPARDIALISKALPEQPLAQLRHRLAVIDIAGR
jgi:hypothetical protein